MPLAKSEGAKTRLKHKIHARFGLFFIWAISVYSLEVRRKGEGVYGRRRIGMAALFDDDQ